MIDISTLTPKKDPMGAAISEYQQTNKAGRLRVLSSMFDEDEIPVTHLFRTFKEMPELEQKALSLAKGRILDVGAGAGCHALELQAKGEDVHAIDISQLSCDAMQARGVKQVQCINLFDRRLTGPFDTILMLMNGTGIIGKLKNMPDFLERIHELLSKEGQVLVDSSDLKYLYENEDGTYDIDPLGPYYGEVDYQMIYRKVKGDSFDWLYVDFNTLKLIAESNGFKCEMIAEGEHYDYLAKLSLA
jgi:SAM-dependent methyltransferase